MSLTTKGDYQEIANRIRIDMDSRSPRLRLSVVGYLVDAGITPKKVGGVNEWLGLVRDTITLIGEDLDEFADGVENFEVSDEVGDEDSDGYEILKLKEKDQGYL